MISTGHSDCSPPKRSSVCRPETEPLDGAAAVRSWAKLRVSDVDQTANFLGQLERGGDPSIAKLSLANSQIQKMAATEQ